MNLKGAILGIFLMFAIEHMTSTEMRNRTIDTKESKLRNRTIVGKETKLRNGTMGAKETKLRNGTMAAKETKQGTPFPKKSGRFGNSSITPTNLSQISISGTVLKSTHSQLSRTVPNFQI